MTASQSTDRLNISYAMQAWRENILRTAFFAAAIFGLLALLTSFPQNLAAQITYVVAYVIILVAAFLPLPYQLRAGIFLLLTYALAVQFFFLEGIWSNGRAFLLFFVFMSGMLFSMTASILAALMSIGTMSVLGWLIVEGQITITSPILPPGEAAHWISGITSTLLPMIIAIVAQHVLQREVERAYRQNQASIALLQEERARLEERVAERTQILERRARLFNAINRISSQISSLQEVERILSEVPSRIEQLLENIQARIFIVDEDGRHLIPYEEAPGDTPQAQPSRWIRVGDSSLIGTVAMEKAPRLLTTTTTEQETMTVLALPLLARGKSIGVLELKAFDANLLTTADIDILKPLAEQLALAIENTRLIAESQRLVGQMQKILAEQTATVWDEFLSRRTWSYEYTPLGIKPAGKFALEPGSHVLEIPIRLRNREIGRIALQRKADLPPWSEKERTVVQEVANQVALALENSRLLASTQQRAYQERILNEITSQLSRSVDSETLLQTMARELRQIPGVSEVAVYLTPPRSAENTTKL